MFHNCLELERHNSMCILTRLYHCLHKKEKYEDCTDKCFEGPSLLSDFAAALKVRTPSSTLLYTGMDSLICTTYVFSSQNFKPQVLASEDNDLEKCFEKCGDGKDADDADDIKECQLDCVEEQVVNGRSRSSLGPNGEFLYMKQWHTHYICKS